MREGLLMTLRIVMVLSMLSIMPLLIASAIVTSVTLFKLSMLSGMLFIWSTIELGLMLTNQEGREP